MIRFLFALLLLGFAGCSCRMEVPAGLPRIQAEAPVMLYGHALNMHLSRPVSGTDSRFLVVYSTGDGGWRGLDRDVFEWISAWNYPVAGFSSKSYLQNLGYVSDSYTTTPRRLVRDFEQIIGFAERQLGLSENTSVILVGLSRGAGLSVVAAGQGGLTSHLGGLVAIALTKEEEHVVRYRRRRASASEPPKTELVEIQTYEYLPRLASFPVVVIQSEGDNYLPAKDARALFGPDTDLRKLRAVEASNHRFSGGCDALYGEIQTSLRWIAH